VANAKLAYKTADQVTAETRTQREAGETLSGGRVMGTRHSMTFRERVPINRFIL